MDDQYDHAYRTVDKSTWSDGPWQSEYDKAQWIDQDTSLDCLIVRNKLGSLCGYVGVTSDHPWHDVGYYECTFVPACDEEWCLHSPVTLLSVHGGITFAGPCEHSLDESVGICHVPLPGRSDDIWWFGFDTAHYGDLSPNFLDLGFIHEKVVYRDESYVRAECADLARQLFDRSEAVAA